MFKSTIFGVAGSDTDMAPQTRIIRVPVEDPPREVERTATIYVYNVYYGIDKGDDLETHLRQSYTVLAFGLENAIDKARRHIDRLKVEHAVITGVERIATVDVP